MSAAQTEISAPKTTSTFALCHRVLRSCPRFAWSQCSISLVAIADVAADSIAGGSAVVVSPLVDRGDGHAEVVGELGDAEQSVAALVVGSRGGVSAHRLGGASASWRSRSATTVRLRVQPSRSASVSSAARSAHDSATVSGLRPLCRGTSCRVGAAWCLVEELVAVVLVGDHDQVGEAVSLVGEVADSLGEVEGKRQPDLGQRFPASGCGGDRAQRARGALGRRRRWLGARRRFDPAGVSWSWACAARLGDGPVRRAMVCRC